jgi:hypothetical protein
MLKQHKNALLSVIKKSNIDPALFRGIDSTSNPSRTSQAPAQVFGEEIAETGRFTVELREAPLRFSVTHQAHDFDKFQFTYTVFMPGFPELTWRKAQGITELVREFKDWLDVWVIRYIEEDQLPDLWAQLETYKPLVGDTAISYEDTSNFSAEEQAQARQSISQFRISVLNNFDPSPDQLKSIDEKLNYLARAVDRLNRLDWRALAVSTVISIAVNLSADTERGRLLFRLFQDAFRSSLKLLQ